MSPARKFGPRVITVSIALALISPTLTACSPQSVDTKVVVTASATECSVNLESAPAGIVQFAITNPGDASAEFYVLSADHKRTYAEKENIGSGLTINLIADLDEGEYALRCDSMSGGSAKYVPFNVTASATSSAETAEAATAIGEYLTWVDAQGQAALALTKEFAEAVKSGDIAQAKALYPKARWHWEAIEPIAESFGDLDPILDARDGDLEPGTPWTGWHPLEQQLWQTGLQANSAELADGLVANTTELVSRIGGIELKLAQMANGAKALLDEVATGKITGEEERYSHTDLSDFAANLYGARIIVEASAPLLTSAADQAYLADLLARFDELESALAAYASSAASGTTKLDEYVPFVSYTELTATQIAELAQLVEGVSEPLSQLAAKLVAKG